MNLKEIEIQRYVLQMRLRSVEAGFKRVDPFSSEFDCLMNNAIKIKESLRELQKVELIEKLEELK